MHLITYCKCNYNREQIVGTKIIHNSRAIILLDWGSATVYSIHRITSVLGFIWIAIKKHGIKMYRCCRVLSVLSIITDCWKNIPKFGRHKTYVSPDGRRVYHTNEQEKMLGPIWCHHFAVGVPSGPTADLSRLLQLSCGYFSHLSVSMYFGGVRKTVPSY